MEAQQSTTDEANTNIRTFDLRKDLEKKTNLAASKCNALAEHFGSMEAIKNADYSDLIEVDHIGTSTAYDILDCFEAEADDEEDGGADEDSNKEESESEEGEQSSEDSGQDADPNDRSPHTCKHCGRKFLEVHTEKYLDHQTMCDEKCN